VRDLTPYMTDPQTCAEFLRSMLGCYEVHIAGGNVHMHWGTAPEKWLATPKEEVKKSEILRLDSEDFALVANLGLKITGIDTEDRHIMFDPVTEAEEYGY